MRGSGVRFLGWIASLALVSGCVEQGADGGDEGGGSSGLMGMASSSSGAGGTTLDTPGSTGGLEGSTGASPEDGSSGGEGDGPTSGFTMDLPDDQQGAFAVGSFVIPAGTIVDAFTFEAEAEWAPGDLDGRTLLVAVVDISHPDRDQTELCPGNHPLDGCATVDYGAFGDTYDNRVTFEGPRGPWSVHMYKDRSLQLEPEPLPDFE